MQPKLILRPVEEKDLAQVTELVARITGGMTTLPGHPDHLSNRINDSIRAFDPRIRKPAGESYLFVLEDLEQGAIVGTSGIVSRVGGFDPFYTYRLESHLQEYEPLNVHNSLKTLTLSKNHKGPSEICSLFLDPAYRKHGTGKLLSLSRFCFIKAFPDRFDNNIIAELRGFIDDAGRSPFWEAVGKNFFWSDYYAADVLSGIGEKDFIEALMPEHPIYVNLLPASAREVIGKVHPQTEPAKAILIKEGFRETDEVDIFDAGPILMADREDLATWKAAQTAPVEIGDITKGKGLPTLVTSTSLDFRATICPVEANGYKRLRIPAEAAAALHLEDGEEAQFLSI
jgi:arginine N-succinyltransferase